MRRVSLRKENSKRTRKNPKCQSEDNSDLLRRPRIGLSILYNNWWVLTPSIEKSVGTMVPRNQPRATRWMKLFAAKRLPRTMATMERGEMPSYRQGLRSSLRSYDIQRKDPRNNTFDCCRCNVQCGKNKIAVHIPKSTTYVLVF